MAELASTIYMAVFLGSGIWMTMAQVAYVSLYKSKVGDPDVDAFAADAPPGPSGHRLCGLCTATSVDEQLEDRLAAPG